MRQSEREGERERERERERANLPLFIDSFNFISDYFRMDVGATIFAVGYDFSYGL